MEQLFGALAKVVADIDQDGRGRSAIVFAAWRRAAGTAIAGKARAVEFNNNRLVIEVNDDAWLPHLKALAPQMVAKLNALVGNGTVKRIEFR